MLLGRYSIWGPLLAALLVVGVAVGALLLSERDVFGGRGAQGQEVSRSWEGVTEATVVIEPGIAQGRAARCDAENKDNEEALHARHSRAGKPQSQCPRTTRCRMRDAV